MHLKWDKYSDQPKVIKDKALKKRIYKQTRWAFIKLLAVNFVIYPVSFLLYLFVPAKKSSIKTKDFFGMSVNLDKNPQDSKVLIDDLQLENLLIRMPLSDIENLQAYVEFAEQFKDKNILINILQDRQHIEDLNLLHESLDKIFQQFSHLTLRFQIGNAINRKKWGFFSMDEYLHFYQVAYQLKKQKYPELTFLSSSIIDFEFYFTIRTLFNFHKIYFDECSSLLYVDRRGAPENPQMGLDLTKKLHFLQILVRLSPKTGNDIVVTETNWPISNTAPYAPTSEKECVSLDDHASFLVRYYLLALGSGVVKNVYWHQLIAPGYGLIDNRDGKLIKYPAFYAFKTMYLLLSNAEFVSLKVTGELYQAFFKCLSKEQTIEVCWALEPCTMKTNNRQVILRDGSIQEPIETVQIGSSPIYLLTKSCS